jgi:hypothetical protein
MFNDQNFKWLVSLIVLIILCFGFYWHQLRPNQIKSTCNRQSLSVLEESDFYDSIKYENMYIACLRSNGLEK